MPSKTKAQRNFMAAVAHSPSFAKKAGVPQSVGKEFNQADKGRKFNKGGETMATQKKVAPTPMGKVKTAAPSRDGVAVKGKTKGTQIKMAKGGKAKGMMYGGSCK